MMAPEVGGCGFARSMITAAPIVDPERTGMAACREMMDDHMVHSGWLRKQANNLGRDWKRRYFVLTLETLCYYASERGWRLGQVRGRIELMAVSIKAMPTSDKYHWSRFRIITPTRDYLLEAESLQEAIEWIGHLNQAIQRTILHCTRRQLVLTSEERGSFVVGGASLAQAIREIPANDTCADCHATLPTWVSINLGIVLCIDCAGVHRSLSGPISKVRSLELDIFPLYTIELLRRLGNQRVNALLEASLPSPTRRPPIHCKDSLRRAFIEAKYVHLLFSTHPQTPPSETILTETARAMDVPTALPVISSSTASPLLPLSELELFDAVRCDSVMRSVELLLIYKVNVNARHCITGTTPLHHAALSGQHLQTHWLLLNGADPMASDQQGRTPAELALRSGHASLADHIAKYANNSIGTSQAKLTNSPTSITTNSTTTAATSSSYALPRPSPRHRPVSLRSRVCRSLERLLLQD